MTQADTNRRPLKTRSTRWAQRMAAALAAAGVSPNSVSVTSVVFAAAGAAVLLTWHSAWALVACAAAVQLRLLCNLLDGMIAIEGGKASVLGGLYNELPDRIGDSIFIVALGYAAGIPEVGWFGALAAAITAYIRATGGALGLPQDFRGPMAKPHRMAAMTVGCLAAAIELPLNGTTHALAIASWVIAIGAVGTCITRTVAVARRLRERAP